MKVRHSRRAPRSSATSAIARMSDLQTGGPPEPRAGPPPLSRAGLLPAVATPGHCQSLEWCGAILPVPGLLAYCGMHEKQTVLATTITRGQLRLDLKRQRPYTADSYHLDLERRRRHHLSTTGEAGYGRKSSVWMRVTPSVRLADIRGTCARIGPSGEPILFLDQHRARWDQLLS